MKRFGGWWIGGTAALGALLLVGCSSIRRGPLGAGTAGYLEQAIAPGVTARHFPAGHPVSGASAVWTLEVDLRTQRLRLEVAADGPSLERGRVFGTTWTVRQWCERRGALGGVNGGFFGLTSGIRKEVIGLLAQNGVIVASGQLVRSRTDPDRRFVRSVFGIGEDGTPRIGWAVGRRGRGALLTDYVGPQDASRQRFWSVRTAVACGPRLVHDGLKRITDREERLVSRPALRRTFVAYDEEGGRPRRLLLGVADAMTYSDVADFVLRHFQRYHNSACAAAMCLDGGSSSQLVYSAPSGYAEAFPSIVTVPTAVLVLRR